MFLPFSAHQSMADLTAETNRQPIGEDGGMLRQKETVGTVAIWIETPDGDEVWLGDCQ
jgi:hypothetical protein